MSFRLHHQHAFRGTTVRPKHKSCFLGSTALRATNEPGGSPASTNTGSTSRTTQEAANQGPQLNLGDPASTIVWGGRLPSTRRLAVGGLSAIGIALGGNLGGVTSWLLGLDGGQLAAQLHADVLIPVRGFKRCVDAANGYEFQYPAQWLADQTLYRRAVQRAEASRSLDPQPLRQRRKDVTEPSAAFGPAGTTGEENISVIVAPIYEGFQLRSLGTPQDAAQNFLDTIVAPPGSDKTARLVAAHERRDAGDVVYYQFEYTVSSPKFDRHNVSVLAGQDNLLFTLNAQCPESKWEQDGNKLIMSAASFRLTAPTNRHYPGTLS